MMMHSDRGIDGRLELHHARRMMDMLNWLTSIKRSILRHNKGASGSAAKHFLSYFVRLLTCGCMQTISPSKGLVFSCENIVPR